MPSRLVALAALTTLALLTGCSSPSYVYHYVPGKTATLEGGHAVAPPAAPPAVQAAVAAGNRIAGLPYCYGAGHCRGIDTAYDCSGSASYVLREAGLIDEATTSDAFRHYGRSGEGEWISIYARRGHVFLVIAGVRFDTGWGSGPRGPQWSIQSRPATGAVIRHPAGL
jgi:hypothetical protein